MPLPSLPAIANSFDFSPKKEGHFPLGERGLSTWKVQNATRFHEAPESGGKIITAAQLAEDRVNALKRVLEGGGINFEHESSATIQREVQKWSRDILSGLKNDGHEWHVIGNTSSMVVVDKDGHAHIVDVPDSKFRDPDFIDYSTLGKDTDGGAKIREEQITGQIIGTISGEVFRDLTRSGGGNRSLEELYEHPFLKAMLTDPQLRNDYLVALGILDSLQLNDNGSQSLWVPHDLPEFYMRWIALGLKANAIYPPNLKTVGFNVLMRKKAS